jgi:UDP-2,3-diacylglucosamine pyrophosphatase LpxH
VRRALGVPGYWSLAGYAKRQVKTAVAFIADFEAAVVTYAKARRVDGVICGHVHAAADCKVDGLRYLNCGDWVDSCTAIVEQSDGRVELLHCDAIR